MFVKEIKKIRENVIVIAQTAYVSSVETDRRKYLANGFDDFIEKPFPMNTLSELIEKYS